MPIIELYPSPLPPPGPPVTRESTLADVQNGFASLTEDELLLARLWLVGDTLDDACYALKKSEKAVRRIWGEMRRKLRFALLDEAERAIEGPQNAAPTRPGSEPVPGA